MKRNNNRKAFTIVELVIVIAVIAILAAVMIPTLGDIIEKANDSKALQEAKNAYTNYIIENNGMSAEYMLYNANGRWVALRNGAAVGVYENKEEALKALDLTENKFTNNGDENLWVYDENVESDTDWSGASSVFVGDSITYGASTTKTYHAYLKETMQLGTVTPKGISGSCYSAKSDYGASNTPLINRYQDIPQNQDLIVIFMGTNDYGHETPLGAPEDSSDVSFYGALNAILPAVKAAHPNSQLVVMTPLHRYGFGTSRITGEAFTYDNLPNGVNAKLSDYIDAIKTVCQKNDIPVIDLFTLFPLNPTDEQVRNEYMPDGLHPNAKGHEILADIIAEELKKIPRKENNTETPETPEYTPDYSLRIGNRFGGASFATTPTRACTENNIYLKAGTIITIKDNATYDWAVSQETSEDSTKQGKYVFSAGWDTSAYRVIESDGWYGFTLARKSNFDLGGADSSDLLDYFVIVEQVEMQNDNRFAPNSTTASTRLSSAINLYIPAGTVITFKSDTPATHWAISKTTTAVSSELNYKTSNSGNAWTPQTTFTITEDGWYGFVLKNDNTALSPTDCNLFDFFVIFGYND